MGQRQRHLMAIFTAALAVSSCVGSEPRRESGSLNCVTYRGEVVSLARTYRDFDEYKEDPKNLPPRELERVARLVREAPVPRSFKSRGDAFQTLRDLAFPGYGFGGDRRGDAVALFTLEIPLKAEARRIAVEERDGDWWVVDDFLWPTARGELARAERVGDHLVYFGYDGTPLREQ